MKKIFIGIVICFTSMNLSAQFQSSSAQKPDVVIKHVGVHRIVHKYNKRRHKHRRCQLLNIKNSNYQKYSVALDSAITTDTLLNNFVKTWIGTRYIWGGSGVDGVDCSGFSRILYDSVYHIRLPRTAKEQYKIYGYCKIDSLSTGALIFFKVPNKRTRWHVGVYLTNGYFIHASGHKTGVIISKMTGFYVKHMVTT
jgi:cell wall-associated NlpC family hydrolase